MILHFKEVDSTNEVAKKLAAIGAPEWTIVSSDSQTEGKGRLGRRWISPQGGLWISIVLRPDIEESRLPIIPMVSGISVAKVLCDMYGLPAKLKWPNDVLLKERKVCGILAEAGENVEYVVVGIGINANIDMNKFPAQLRNSTTTISTELKREVDLNALKIGLLDQFKEDYNNLIRQDFSILKEEWRHLSSTLGQKVKVITPKEIIEGNAIDIDGEGALLIEVSGRIKRIFSGDCIHLSNF